MVRHSRRTASWYDIVIRTRKRVRKNLFRLRNHEGDLLARNDDEEFEEWADKIQGLFLALVGAVGMIKLRAHYKMVGYHYAIALAARLGVDAAGVIIAHQIDGQSGVDAWREYSNDVFSVDDFGLIPNPIAVIESIAESEMMIREHYGTDAAVQRFAVQGSASIKRQALTTGFSYVSKVVRRGLPSIRTFTL